MSLLLQPSRLDAAFFRLIVQKVYRQVNIDACVLSTVLTSKQLLVP